MTNLRHTDFFVEVAKGNVAGHSVIHKFGAGDLTTSILPVTQDNTYPTPTAATALEVVSGNLADAAAGLGAQQVTITGLDSSWNEVSQTITMNGTVAVPLTTNLIRLYRWYVSRSGAYASETSGSHLGVLTIQGSGGGTVWSTITNSPFAVGQSQIGVYTIPTGYTGYLLNKSIHADTSKTADIYFFQRPLADDVTTPFTGTMRLVQREVGVQGGHTMNWNAPKGGFVGPCDVGFMGKVSSGTAECSVEFEILLVEDGY